MKRFLILFMLILGISFGGQIFFFDTAEAADYWCSNDGYYDYYVNSDSISITASDLHYVDVDCSDGSQIRYCFQYFNGDWSYDITEGSRKTNGFRPIMNSKLANDILYVTLQIEKNRNMLR